MTDYDIDDVEPIYVPHSKAPHSKAPERIWIDKLGNYAGERIKQFQTEYIRADIAEKEIGEYKRLANNLLKQKFEDIARMKEKIENELETDLGKFVPDYRFGLTAALRIITEEQK